jgi:hypothetical protein
MPCKKSHGFSRLILLVGLSLSALLFALPRMDWSQAGTAQHASSKTSPVAIADVRLGQRVLAQGPETLSPDELAEPQQADCRLLRLEMVKTDSSLLEVGLLRSTDWIQANEAVPGAVIDLDLPELGAVGGAQVLAIEPSPPLEEGAGCLVTGRFVHQAANVLRLYVEGQAEPLGVTSNHPVWSEDRRDFIPAGDLAVGERLRALGGHPRVLKLEPLPGVHPVYNIEVHGLHVYHVTTDGLLVHNAYPRGEVPKPKTADEIRVKEQRDRRAKHRENRSRKANGQKKSGEGFRDRESANKGPQGQRPKGPGGKNRERNIGIDEEHNRVEKGTGGGQRRF